MVTSRALTLEDFYLHNANVAPMAPALMAVYAAARDLVAQSDHKTEASHIAYLRQMVYTFERSVQLLFPPDFGNEVFTSPPILNPDFPSGWDVHLMRRLDELTRRVEELQRVQQPAANPAVPQ